MASFTYVSKWDPSKTITVTTPEPEKNQEKSEPMSTSKEDPRLGKIAEMQKAISELMDEHAKQGKRLDDLVGHHKALNDMFKSKGS